MSSEIKIYVACLSAYNNGILHGAWIDATQGIDGINDDVQTMLKASPMEDAEEWAIHDYEGFGSYRLSEYEGFGSVCEIAEFLEDHGEIGSELLAHYSNTTDAKKAIEECYVGQFKSLAAYAEELTSDTHSVPENLTYYIDYDRMGRDMEMSGDIYTIETAHDEVHVFWNH